MQELARPRPKPPANVAPYGECLGFDGAADFLLAFGGGEISLASNPGGRGAVEAAVGREALAAMSAHARIGPRLRVPLAKTWLAAVLHWRGLSTAAIARPLHASDVSVRKWIRERAG